MNPGPARIPNRHYDFNAYPEFSPDQPFVLRRVTLKNRLDVAHFHTGVEIGVCLSDHGRMYLDGQYYPMQSGDAYFLDSMLPHGHENTELLVCEAKSDCIISAAPVRGDLRLYQPFISLRMGVAPVLKNLPAVQGHLEKALACLKRGERDWPLWAWPDVLAAFTESARAALSHIRSTVHPLQPKNQQALFRALDFIHANFTSRIRVEELAAHCFLSPSRFAHLFSQLMHCSPIEYRNLLRVGKAVELLAQTSDKIEIIAEQCGFNSLAQFNKLFKKVTGHSPNILRRNMQAGSI